MTEKISIFDVEISCIKAKEAMMQAIEFMKGDSVNTIELVSMESPFMNPIACIIASFALIQEISTSNIEIFSVIYVTKVITFQKTLRILTQNNFSPFCLFYQIYPYLSKAVSFKILLLFIFHHFYPQFLSVFLSLVFFR